MKKFWQDIKWLLPVFMLWRVLLFLIQNIAPSFFPLKIEYLGEVGWSNFDGIHYLSIAHFGYSLFQQAFFPLYPLLIRLASLMVNIPAYLLALTISHITFFIGLVFFYKLYRNKWAVILLLLFPTSFYFASIYTESLFFCLAVGTFYAAKCNQWKLVGVFGALASLTRLFGIFLFPLLLLEYWSKLRLIQNRKNLFWLFLIPLGLLTYMIYLNGLTGDPLAFFHVQTAFGSERSVNKFILLPQVVWRYLKIFITYDFFAFTYYVAIFEFIVLLFMTVALFIGWKSRFSRSQIFYSLIVLMIPTLTGTLSSLPRYALSAFPLFFILGNIHNTYIKIIIAVIFSFGLFWAASAFLQGYFVS